VNCSCHTIHTSENNIFPTHILCYMDVAGVICTLDWLKAVILVFILYMNIYIVQLLLHCSNCIQSEHYEN
jgi:hypothetical protein